MEKHEGFLNIILTFFSLHFVGIFERFLEMECIEARALKSSFLPELAVKSTQQLLFEDVWCVKGINSVVPCEDFSVDDLFDFSDKDFKDGSLEESEEDEEKEPLSTASSPDQVNDDFSTTFSCDFISLLPTDDLSVPVDDLENLEWLSQFVDDSASELSLLCPAGKFEKKAGNFFENRSEPQVQKRQLSCFESPVPSKVRSKRLRPSWSVWFLSSPSLSDTSSVSSSTSSHDSNLTSPLLITNPVRSIDSSTVVTGPPAKKQKRKLTLETVAGSGGCQTQRRCSHCGVQKTPQWRAGPMGAKTLCNACGVRFKSGRLLPEYRPACSPTYSVDIHSNSHRKVLELRRKKEMSEPAETDLTTTVRVLENYR